jgi:hypothetical protein
MISGQTHRVCPEENRLPLFGIMLQPPQAWFKTPDNLYTISGAPVRDMTAVAAEATESRDGKSMHSAGHHRANPVFAVQRNLTKFHARF